MSSSREGVVLGCFIRILIVSKDTYPYLVIRHVKGLTLSFHLHHCGPLGALRDSLSTNKMSAFLALSARWVSIAGKSVLNDVLDADQLSTWRVGLERIFM